MFPCGQVLGLRSNSTTDINAFLGKEPLHLHGGLGSWEVYKVDTVPATNLNADLYDPYLFIGLFDTPTSGNKKGKTKKTIESIITIQESHFRYHMRSGRVSSLGVLRDGAEVSRVKKPALYDDGCGDAPLDNTDISELPYDYDGNERGVYIMFNCKSNADALKYISSDPLFDSKLYAQTVCYTILYYIYTTHIHYLYTLFHAYFPSYFSLISALISPYLPLQHLSPVNVQDIDGLHWAMPRSFADQELLDQV